MEDSTLILLSCTSKCFLLPKNYFDTVSNSSTKIWPHFFNSSIILWPSTKTLTQLDPTRCIAKCYSCLFHRKHLKEVLSTLYYQHNYYDNYSKETKVVVNKYFNAELCGFWPYNWKHKLMVYWLIYSSEIKWCKVK